MSKKNRMFWESALLNDATFKMYYERLLELSISLFKWEGLPDTVDERFLELALFRDGRAVFFKDEALGFLALRCMIGGRWNVYNIPTRRTAYATNGYHVSLDESNSVLVYNNMVHTTPMPIIEQYALRLYNYDRIIDVNANAQKTPTLIVCDEQQRLALLNVYKQYNGNEPVIYANKFLDTGNFKVLKTDAPYIANKIMELKTETWNEALTYLGVSNINVVKKERMISDEVRRNLGGTIASRYSRLESRRQACKNINQMFGLEIECDYREDYQIYDMENVISETTNPDETEGDINE